jgi:hypothetical protein
MNNFIYGYENWKSIYNNSPEEIQRQTWVYLKFSNQQEIYLKSYEDLKLVQDFVYTNKLNINAVGLRYKSHNIEIDTKNSEAVYIVRSAKGEFGGSTKNCYTVGTVNGDKVNKTMWITPELIEECSYIDDLDNCFEEAIIYHGTKKA